MSSHKRSRSATESDAESSKALKGSNTEPAEDLAQANARIHELEAQVKELQNYLYSQNVALCECTIVSNRCSIPNLDNYQMLQPRSGNS